tara:strand:+ start:1217 stop:2692 length:1476 start_codon:yes stop_codon:yes gene_type:complete
MSRIRANLITNQSADGAPTVEKGLAVQNGLVVTGIATATGRIGVGTVTTSERDALSNKKKGQIIFNESKSRLEYYDGNGWILVDVPPVISGSDVTEVDSNAGGNQTFVISGSNFTSGGTISFVGTDNSEFNASSTTFNNSGQITAVAPRASFLNSKESYKVKFTAPSGLFGISSPIISVDTSPTWSTAAGNIASVLEGASVNVTPSATDSDGDTITYSETTNNLGGAGFSLNSTTGQITGTAAAVSGDTTTSFTLRATANSKTADRSFNIITENKDGSTAAKALQYGSEVITALGGSFSAGLYYLTGKTSMGQSAQQVYVDADGWMLVYRHAGTGGSYNSTYEIRGNTLGEAAVGTLNSPTQGLTDSGSSTAQYSRGLARLSSTFIDALGGQSASGNVIRMTCGGVTSFMTDCKLWWTADSADGYGRTSISLGSTYAGRRSGSGTPDGGRPLCAYNLGYGNVIPYYHGNGYSGGYKGSGWHWDCTTWIRQY